MMISLVWELAKEKSCATGANESIIKGKKKTEVTIKQASSWWRFCMDRALSMKTQGQREVPKWYLCSYRRRDS